MQRGIQLFEREGEEPVTGNKGNGNGIGPWHDKASPYALQTVNTQ